MSAIPEFTRFAISSYSREENLRLSYILAPLSLGIARCEELAVQAALEGDARKVFWACAFAPLTSAVLTLDEIQEKVTEMLEQNKEYLPWYK